MIVYQIDKSEDIIDEISIKQVNNEINLWWHTMFNYFLYARNSSISLQINTQWEKIKWNIFLVWYGSGQCNIDIKWKINHSDCDINILSLCLLQDDNSVSINWDILLSKNISNSQWHLLEKNVILWHNAKITATPKLDVYSDNVHATHGVSIDKISPESLFYIWSRGLSTIESTNIMLSWYIQSMLNYFVHIDSTQKDQIEKNILSNIKISYD